MLAYMGATAFAGTRHKRLWGDKIWNPGADTVWCSPILSVLNPLLALVCPSYKCLLGPELGTRDQDLLKIQPTTVRTA